MGGQRKSQVALEYCRRKRARPYSAIFWVDATSQDRVEGSFQAISERIKRQTDYLSDVNARVAFVLRMLSSWTIKWLLVFDNFDNPDTFPNIRDFIPQSELGAILVTSRHPDSHALVVNRSSHFIELLGLEEDAPVALLIQQSQTNEYASEEAKTIVNRLVCHPLAVTQAGAYIRKRKLRLGDFMDHYKRRKRTILENMPQLSQYRKRLGNAEEETSLNAFTTWELSFQQLRSEAPENNVEAKLLTLLAFFDEKNISEQLFAVFSTNQQRMPETAKLLMWLNAFSYGEGQWDSDIFEDALIHLRDSSLLQAFGQESDGFYHISLHPLVKDWIRLRTDRSISEDRTYMAAALVTEILSNSWQKEHFDLPLHAKQNILSHIEALEKSYQEFFTPQQSISSNGILFEEYQASQFWVSKFLWNTGSYHLTEIILQRLMVHYMKVWGPNHPDTLDAMHNLALTYSDQGRFNEAEELQEQVMMTSSRVLGLEHSSTLTSISNLALTYLSQGRWKEAEELEVRAMETRKKMLGLEHPATLNSINNLALAFMHQGRWKEAEELSFQVMETRKRVLGLEHPDTMVSIDNFASTLIEQVQLTEAEELAVQVMGTSKKVLGLEHPDTLSSMNNLATAFWNQGRWKEAEDLLVQVIETSKKVLGLEHPDTLRCMHNLSCTFWSLDMKKEAIQLMSEVVQLRERGIGSYHPDTVSSISWLQEWRDEKDVYHPDTATSIRFLQESRDDKDADHPDTATSIRVSPEWRDGKKANRLFRWFRNVRKSK